MTISAHPYDSFLKNAVSGGTTADFSGHVIYVMLTTSTYSPNRATHAAKSDVTNEVTSTGYSAGGQAISNPALTVASNVIKFDGDDSAWTGVTFSARYAVLYDHTSNALVGYVDFGADASPIAANFTITWSGSGIVTITNS